MGAETTLTIGFVIALVGCFIGLAGWLSGRDKKIIGDAQWRGRIDAKLDTVIGFGQSIERLERKIEAMNERLAIAEQSAKSAHHRIDDYLEHHSQ